MEDDKVAKPVVGDVPMEEGGKDVKEAKKKEKKENPKNAKKAERQLARQMEAAAVQEVVDPLAANYGEVELVTLQSATQSGRKWIKVSQLDQELKGQTVLVRGRVHAVRGKGKMAFLVVRESGYTVQCLASIAENIVSKQMLKFISGLNKESIIDVEGEVSVPPGEIAGTSQQVY